MINILHTSINEANHKSLIANYLPKFSAEFQGKIVRYRRWQDAQLSLLGRVLLIKGMEQRKCRFDESDMKYNAFNKPYFDSNDISFNISHSGRIVVCVLTYMGDIGIDIEKIDPIEVSDFKSQMTNNEWKLISESKNISHSFLNYWTQKEAVIKAHGNGLSIPLKSFEIQNNKTTVDSKNFFLKEVTIMNDYSCHVALNKSIDTIEIKTNKIDF